MSILAGAVDIFHGLLLLFAVWGFYLPRKKFPVARIVHWIIVLGIRPLQMLFRGYCPLTLLSGWLRGELHGEAIRELYMEGYVRAVFGSHTHVFLSVVMTIGFGGLFLDLIRERKVFLRLAMAMVRIITRRPATNA